MGQQTILKVNWHCQQCINKVSVSVSAYILTNKAAHHASAHGGVSANALSYIWVVFFGNDYIIIIIFEMIILRL